MTTYTTPEGAEILVCDGCGIDCDGNRPDLSRLTRLDPTDGLRAYLHMHGGGENRGRGGEGYEHFCPVCGPGVAGAKPIEEEVA